jgi:ribonuclease J
MWSGYLDNPSYLDILKPQIKHIHTSGHAYVKDLQEFVQRIKPKVIIPIHTQLPEKYTELYNAEIKILKDGEILNL